MTVNIEINHNHASLLDGPNPAVLKALESDGQSQSTGVAFLPGEDGVLETPITTERHKHRMIGRMSKATLFDIEPTNSFRSIEVPGTIHPRPVTDKALLPQVASRNRTLVEVLDLPGSDRFVATLTAVLVVANG